MPRTAYPSSALRTPLDRLLGSVATIRVVRVLARDNLPISQAELARRAEINLRGLSQIVVKLDQGGLIEYVGRGGSRQLRFRDRSPLAQAIRQLFQAEAARAESVPARLRELGASFTPEIQSIWITRWRDVAPETGDAFLDIGLLWAGAPSLKTRDSVQRRLNEIQSLCDVSLELRSFTQADLKTASASALTELAEVETVFGPSPTDLLTAWQTSSSSERGGSPDQRTRPIAHALHDRRSKKVAQLIAAKVARDPSLVAKARTYLTRREAIAGDAEKVTLSEWRGIIDSLSVRQLCAFLVSESERATRLRQSLPFVDALTQAERDSIFRSRGQVK